MIALFSHLVERQGLPAENGPIQMAVDEFLLVSSTEVTLRFYDWVQPQITFGYFGIYSEVQKNFPNQLLTRRWTGGGVVFHGQDVTFSLCIPASHSLAQERGGQIYRAIHDAICVAFAQVGIATSMAQEKEKFQGGNCFTSPVEHDVLGAEGKIAGGAMRRTKQGLLYQGSIQCAEIQNGELRNWLRQSFSNHTILEEFQEKEFGEIQKISAARYGTADWLEMGAKSKPPIS